MSDVTPAHIAREIASSLHDEYRGFAVDYTDVGESRVPAGTIHVSGYVDDDPEREVRFVVTITEVEVDW